MAELVYTSVVWTAGDVITEAKMDNMVANDQAVNSHTQGMRMSERADPALPPANTLHLYVKDNAGVSSLYFIDDSGTVRQISEYTPIFVFPFPGGLYTGTSVLNALIVPKSVQIVKVYAYATTAPVGAAIICDIKKNGSSIWNSTPAHKITIADSANAGSQTAFDIDTLSEGDTLTLDIDQIGTTNTGANLTIEIKTK